MLHATRLSIGHASRGGTRRALARAHVQVQRLRIGAPLPSHTRTHPSVKLVLLAEDDPAIAQLLEELIRDRLHFSTLVVANGALVTDAIAQQRPDLLILDVALPGLSGLDVFDLVRSSPIYRGVPVLFLTANPDQARSTDNDTRVMAKPFDVDALVGVIADMIGTLPAAA
ncbi:MAG: response regulator [Chloroflexi bacterium]|nr:MAG: response regulator [Chloroflexota bacterium]